jgi:hypothetical protein
MLLVPVGQEILSADGVRTGSLRSGSRGATELDLVELLGASEAPAGGALAAPEQEGELIRQVARGTFLRRVQRCCAVLSAIPAPCRSWRFVHAWSRRSSHSTVREATSSGIELIATCHGRGGSAARYQDWRTRTKRCHRAIAEYTHNVLMIGVSGIYTQPTRLPVRGQLRHRVTCQGGALSSMRTMSE